MFLKRYQILYTVTISLIILLTRFKTINGSKLIADLSGKMCDSDWKLYYWPGFKGRGEFVRLMFEEAGVAYTEINDRAEVFNFYSKGSEKLFPLTAPPIIQNGDFVLCQTTAIIHYLGKKFNLYPTGGEEEEAHAMQVALGVQDFVGEGRACFHPIKPYGSHSLQVEESKPYIADYLENRATKFLGNFEKTLAANGNGEGFMIGNSITYVDLALFQALEAFASQFPEEWAKAEYPKLRAFRDRIAARPNIAAFLASDRCKPFAGDSMM